MVTTALSQVKNMKFSGLARSRKFLFLVA